jgi:hypothetical protein
MNSHTLMRFFSQHGDKALAVLLGIAVFSVYLQTLCPTVYWGDCGELATVAVTMGVPHPTGYPLYCLLGKAWTLLLPLGSPVWRLNVLSAVFGTGAVLCLYGFARTIALPRPLALTSAGLLAFASTFWQQCLLTETYTLAAFFTCLNLFLAARWKLRGCRTRDLAFLALAYGFTLTSHQTNTLFLPGFLAFILWSDPALRQLGDRTVRNLWAKTLGMGALPLLLYAYLPLRARTHPAYNWGDIETPFAFFYHVTGRAFSAGMFHDPLPTVEWRLLKWAESLPKEFSWPLVALCILGLALFWRQRTERPLALLLTWIALADIVFAIDYSIYNAYIYFIPCYAVMSVCAGRGLLGLWQALEPQIEPGKRSAYAALAALCVLALVPVQEIGHHSVSLRGNWTCYDYGRNILASVPPHGILIESGDDTAGFGINYLQIVEHRRPDVVMIRRAMLASLYDSRYQKFVNVWYLHDLKRNYPRLCALYPPCGVSAVQVATEDPLRRIIRDAVAHHTPVCALNPAGSHMWFKTPLFLDDDGSRATLEEFLKKHYQTAQIGLLMQVYPADQKPSAAFVSAETARVWKSYTLRGVFDGDLQKDQYLAPLAVNYGNSSLACAQIAYRQGDYAAAADAYIHVLSLFQSDEATQGLEQCRQHARHNAAVASARQ